MVKRTHYKSVFCTLFILCWLFSSIVMADDASKEKKSLSITLKELISPGSG
jgi:hypothetical protein